MLNKATFRNVKATLRNIAAQIAVHLRRLLRISKRHVVVLDAVTPNTNLTSGIRGSLEKKKCCLIIRQCLIIIIRHCPITDLTHPSAPTKPKVD